MRVRKRRKRAWGGERPDGGAGPRPGRSAERPIAWEIRGASAAPLLPVVGWLVLPILGE